MERVRRFQYFERSSSVLRDAVQVNLVELSEKLIATALGQNNARALI